MTSERAIRATAQDARSARILGVDTNKVYATTFAINAAICGAAGALVVMTWVIQPFAGLAYTIRSFMIYLLLVVVYYPHLELYMTSKYFSIVFIISPCSNYDFVAWVKQVVKKHSMYQ